MCLVFLSNFPCAIPTSDHDTRQQTISQLVCNACGGVNWERWTQIDKVWLEQVSDCTVSYRVRKQYGLKKMVTVFGPADNLTFALNIAIEILAARTWGWGGMQWLPAPPMGWGSVQWTPMPFQWRPTIAAASSQTFPAP